MTDSAGKRYLDGIGGLWCVNIGYGRQEMAQAIAEQVLKLSYSNTFTDCTNEPAAELAAKLAEIAPGSFNHVAYSMSGSCANDTAIRLAHYYHSRRGEPNRRIILSRYNSYHGSTYLGMTLGNARATARPIFATSTACSPSVGPLRLSAAGRYQRSAIHGSARGGIADRDSHHWRREYRRIHRRAIQGAGGVVPPPPGYLPRMREVLARHGFCSSLTRW